MKKMLLTVLLFAVLLWSVCGFAGETVVKKIMDACQIEKRNFQQVYEVLGSMPGVDVNNSSGGPGTRISIRSGGGSGSVPVQFDSGDSQIMISGGGSHKAGRRDNSQKDQGHLSLSYDREKDRY